MTSFSSVQRKLCPRIRSISTNNTHSTSLTSRIRTQTHTHGIVIRSKKRKRETKKHIKNESKENIGLKIEDKYYTMAKLTHRFQWDRKRHAQAHTHIKVQSINFD